MGYENAPATEMLASRCACCARQLVDSQSVETGVGPVCRKKYLVADAVTGEARIEGNKLIHRIATLQRGEGVASAISRLKELGFAHVVERIMKRLHGRPAISLSYQGNRILMKASVPSGAWDAWLRAMRRVPGMRYEGRGEGNSFPMDQKRSVWRLLKQFFMGQQGIGPKGAFTIV